MQRNASKTILIIVVGVLVLATAIGLGRFYQASRAMNAKKIVPDDSRRGEAENLLQQLAQQKSLRSSNTGTAPGRGAADTWDDLPSLFQLSPRNIGPSGTLPSWKAAPAELLSTPKSRIPLCAGLTVVTSINQPMIGDHESIKRVTNLSDAGMEIKYSANMPYWGDPLGPRQKSPTTVTVSSSRTVQRADLERSHHYLQDFVAGLPDVIPGTTAINVSRAVLEELKSKGESAFIYHSKGFSLGSMLGALAGGPAPSSGPPKPVDPNLLPRAACTLKRVGTSDVAISVLVNSEPVELTAVRASCSPDAYTTAQFYFLDDPENPLALAWQLEQNGDQLQVVKISFPGGAPAPIARELATSGRAEVYGIYFDFGSDKIRPESEPVVKEISDALSMNPAWKLNVEGHTDSIGGDAYNQLLSERRAAAVKQALADRYHIAANRLSTAGYGATRPKDSNDKMEGRSRNRRVELVRQ